VNRPSAVQTVLIDNARVRVSQWRFAPGAATGWHRHEHDYVVVPLTTGRLVLEEQGGERVAELTLGVPYFREAGVEHDVVNGSGGEFAFIEVELRGTGAS
jgi:quercetin dioxygenase-like cupin family protein